MCARAYVCVCVCLCLSVIPERKTNKNCSYHLALIFGSSISANNVQNNPGIGSLIHMEVVSGCLHSVAWKFVDDCTWRMYGMQYKYKARFRNRKHSSAFCLQLHDDTVTVIAEFRPTACGSYDGQMQGNKLKGNSNSEKINQLQNAKDSATE